MTSSVMTLRFRAWASFRSEEHTSELQSRLHLVCSLVLANYIINTYYCPCHHPVFHSFPTRRSSDLNDPDVFILIRVIAPNVKIPLRRTFGCFSRALKPWMLIGGVVDDKFCNDLEIPCMGFLQIGRAHV